MNSRCDISINRILVFLVTLFATVGLTLVSPVARAEASPQAPPDCGTSVYVGNISYNDPVTNFRVIGVDLNQWLRGSYGQMVVGITDANGYQGSEEFPASPNGARTKILGAYDPVYGDDSVIVDVSIEVNNNVRCTKTIRL